MDAFIYNNIVAACIKVAPNNPGRDSVILYPPVVYIYGVCGADRWSNGRCVTRDNSPPWCVRGQLGKVWLSPSLTDKVIRYSWSLIKRVQC